MALSSRQLLIVLPRMGGVKAWVNRLNERRWSPSSISGTLLTMFKRAMVQQAFSAVWFANQTCSGHGLSKILSSGSR